MFCKKSESIVCNRCRVEAHCGVSVVGLLLLDINEHLMCDGEGGNGLSWVATTRCPVFCSYELSERSSRHWKIWRSAALYIVYTVCAVRAVTPARVLSPTSLISMRTLSKLQIHLRFPRWCLPLKTLTAHLTIVRDSRNTLRNICLIWLKWAMRLVFK